MSRVGTGYTLVPLQKLLTNLSRTTEELSESTERIASGRRINSAADDVGGVALSIYSDSRRLYTAAFRNINDGASVANIANNAVTSLQEIVTRLRELSSQAESTLLSSFQRTALETEADTLVEEYDRIVSVATFNGIEVLGTALSAGIGIQNGPEAIDSYLMKWGGGISTFSAVLTHYISGATLGTGVLTKTQTITVTGSLNEGAYAGDFNNDGNQDLAIAAEQGDRVYISLGNGDGTFGSVITVASLDVRDLKLADLDNDGNLDIIGINGGGARVQVFSGNGDGTFSQTFSFSQNGFDKIELTDLNNDGFIDIVGVSGNVTAYSLGNGDGTFQATVSTSFAPAGLQDLQVGDFNEDGFMDWVAVQNNSTNAFLFLGAGDGTYSSIVTLTGGSGSHFRRSIDVADVNGDGNLDVITGGHSTSTDVKIHYGNGNGTFSAYASVGSTNQSEQVRAVDITGDGNIDLITLEQTTGVIRVYAGNGDGTFSTPTSVTGGPAESRHLELADFNNDGILDLAADTYGTNSAVAFQQGTSTGSSEVTTITTTVEGSGVPSLLPVDLSTSYTSISTSIFLDSVQDALLLLLAEIGAAQVRLDIQAEMASALSDTYAQTYDRIVSINLAEELARKVSLTLRRDSAISVLAQANQSAPIVLSLLSDDD